MLGETFEIVKPGKYKALAELVVHHPPIIAYHVLKEILVIEDFQLYV
jgi:hypothetical protein